MKNIKILLSIVLISFSSISFGQQKDSKSTKANRTVKDSKITPRIGGPTTPDKQPLYIIDGKVTNEEDFKALDSKKIATINILKEPTSTAIYGKKGSLGVILVTTKDAELKMDKPKKSDK